MDGSNPLETHANVPPETFATDTFKVDHPALHSSGQIAAGELTRATDTATQTLFTKPEMIPLFTDTTEFGLEESKQARELVRNIAPATIDTYQKWMNLNARSAFAEQISNTLLVNGNDKVNPYLIKTAVILRELRDVLHLSRSEARNDVLIKAL